MPRKRYAARVRVGRRRETTGRVSISGNVAGAPGYDAVQSQAARALGFVVVIPGRGANPQAEVSPTGGSLAQ